MIIKGTITKPETKEEVIIEIRCDLCGKKKTRNLWNTHEWGEGDFDVKRTEISYKTGYSYPEGSNHTEYRIDICPDCFTKKLIPWLQSQGAIIQEVENDY